MLDIQLLLPPSWSGHRGSPGAGDPRGHRLARGRGWNAELAWEFLRPHSGREEERLRLEMNRYLGWPGPAPSYKLGEQIWLQARDRPRRAGCAFSLKDFHAGARPGLPGPGPVARGLGPALRTDQERSAQPAARPGTIPGRPFLWPAVSPATSHLDTVTEAALHANLASLDCTQVVIAHRLSTIRDADHILVLHDGHRDPASGPRALADGPSRPASAYSMEGGDIHGRNHRRGDRDYRGQR